MNQKDFTRVVQEALGGTATESAATLAIEAVTRALTDGLAEDREVRLAGFGTFRVRRYPARGLPGAGDTLQLHDWTRFSFTPAPATVRPALQGDGKCRLRATPLAPPTPTPHA